MGRGYFTTDRHPSSADYQRITFKDQEGGHRSVFVAWGFFWDHSTKKALPWFTEKSNKVLIMNVITSLEHGFPVNYADGYITTELSNLMMPQGTSLVFDRQGLHLTNIHFDTLSHSK